MKLYKYRTLENLDRDLDLYRENYFWASTKEDLNDENEFTYNTEPLFEELKIYEKLEKNISGSSSNFNRVLESAKDFFDHAKKSGVFSLSKDPKNNGLWSLYASKSTGYCLVFDSDALIKVVEDPISEQRFLLPVKYSREAPKVLLNDIKDQRTVLTKMLATKSDSWINESEVRIVTDKPGKQRFLPSALRGVIFGSNTNAETKNKILEAFEGRNLDVYQLNKWENTYEYFIEPTTSLIRKQELPPKFYDYVNVPSTVVDNYYVKSHKPLVSENSIRDFLKKFKHDVAERNCNIFLMDADTDLSILKDCFNMDDNYVEKHLVAEMYFGSNEVDVNKKI